MEGERKKKLVRDVSKGFRGGRGKSKKFQDKQRKKASEIKKKKN